MREQPQTGIEDCTTLPSYGSILLAVDSSDHANRGIDEAVDLALHYGSKLSAAHVYAAKLHDTRFRQMEGGLPERFRQEQELERQRGVHDDLITKGLSIITDSYLDQVNKAAERLSRPIQRRSLEGKNYRELVNEANSGSYDLLVIGALGLGAVKSSRLGSVCQRVTRRSNIDTLVIKEPTRSISAGPIVVGVDGSTKAYGGLLTALSLAKAWKVPVEVVSAFDPYYHYVAFNRIAGVLSEEAGQVFKFQQQEKLHEEIIDSGLAKIYQGHLSVAQAIARDYGMEVETILLDGKPHEVIARYLSEVKPSLFVIGTTGIHADPELDIGGNTEYLLSDAQCGVLLSQREHSPQIDRLAEVSSSWTREAEARMQRAPSFIRSMARMAILRYAQEKGHTVITESIVEEATAQLMPGHAEQAMEEIVGAYDRGELKRKPGVEDVIRWSEEATQTLLSIENLSLRGNLSLRAEKMARAAGATRVDAEHIRSFLDDDSPGAAATDAKQSACPFTGLVQAQEKTPQQVGSSPNWTADAKAMVEGVPVGFCREMTIKAAESIAAHNGVELVDEGFVSQVLDTIKAGSDEVETTMPWANEASARLAPIPEFVRGMLVREIEAWAKRNNRAVINHEAVDAVKGEWQQRGVFHLDPADPRSGMGGAGEGSGSDHTADLKWQAAALARLMRVPAGFMRDSSKQRIEAYAQSQGVSEVTLEVAEQGLAQAREAMTRQDR